VKVKLLFGRLATDDLTHTWLGEYSVPGIKNWLLFHVLAITTSSIFCICNMSFCCLCPSLSLDHISSIFFLFLVFFKQNIGGGILGKKVRMVELQQFESLGGLNVTFETLEVKVQTGGYFRG
jgi:hypothetical protein